MKRSIYILLFLLFAANLAAQENYVIDSVCVGTSEIYKIGTTFKGSTWEWYLIDSLGNEIAKPTGTDFWEESSPGDTLWESRINIIWDSTGVFELSVLHFSDHGCDTLEQGRIKVFPLPKAYAGDDMIVCVTNGFTLTTDTAANYSSVLWTTPGDGTFDDDSQLNPTYTPGINDSITGSVILVLTVNGLSGNGTCIPAIDTMEILFGNPIIKLNAIDLLCYNDSTGSVKVTVIGGIAPYIYSWTGPGSYTANSDSIFGLAAGKYTVTLTDNIGCVVTSSVEVKQPDALIAAITADKSMICFGDSIKLGGKQTGGTVDYTQLWSGGGAAYLSAGNIVAPVFGNAPAGLYELIYTVTDANGCVAADTLSVKVNPVYNNTIPLAVCENELPYIWRGQMLNLAGIYTDSLTSINGCDSVLTLNFDIWPITRDTFPATVCENELPFNWQGKLLNTAGFYSDTLLNVNFCDSILILNFDIWPVNRDTFPVTVCKNELPYNWQGKLLNTAGFYSDTLSDINNCDSILVMNFDIWPVYNDTIPLSICENNLPYGWRGQMLNMAGIYSDSLTSINGCDSVLVLNLDVWPVNRDTFPLTVCENELPFNWQGKLLNTAGFYSDTLSGIHSCDSVLILNLDVWPVNRDTISLTICDSELPYTWLGQVFTSGDTVIINVPSVTSGCDTVRTLQLQSVPEIVITENQTICENELPFTWHGEIFTKADTITLNIASVTASCDTIRILQLEVNPLPTDTLQLTVCEDQLPYTWQGELFTAADTIVQNIVSSTSGCDTIRVLQFEVNPLPTDTLQLTVCEDQLPYTWFGYTFTAADTIVINIPSLTAGCDTIRVLELKSIPKINIAADTVICVTELPLTWYGKDYFTTGIYNDTIFSATSCDTVLMLDLKVLPEIKVSLDTIICLNETPFTWFGKDYFTTGIYNDTLVSVAGCDTLLVLDLNILPEIKISLDTIICAAETPFKWYGSDYFTTGIYNDTLTSVTGCDSILLLDLKVEPELLVSVTIVADNTEIEGGESVTFTATTVNEGTVPEYTWFVNDVAVPGAISVVFTYAPDDGDVVYVVLTSNLVCTLGNPAISNKIPIKVKVILPVSVTIAADQVNICEGGSATLTATPVNGGDNPVYAWFVNGVEVPGATSATYNYMPQNGDVVYAVLTSSLTNVIGNPATSNEITLTIRKDLPVSVSIVADKTVICDGETATFTAYPVNGGLNPVYTWFVNNIEIAGETSTIFAYQPKNSDLVYARLTSDLACAFGNPATSNKVPIKVNDNATVSITISADKTDTCEGEPVTYTALPANGGPNPLFEWYVNGVVVPGDSLITFTFIPNDKDAVYAILISDLMCTTGDRAFSNKITNNVREGLPVSVSIISDQTEICEDDLVTYTATPVNGGTNPVYAWYVNGTAVSGETSAILIYQPKKEDEVYAILTSDVECPLGNPANSDSITVVVNEKLPVGVSLVADKNFICEGATVIFTANPVNGGTNPEFTWYVNNIPVPGATSGTYTYQPKNGDVVYVLLTSDQVCISGNTAVSNEVTVSIIGELPVSVAIIADKTEICDGEKVTYTATPVNGGTNPVYAWFLNGAAIPGETKAIFAYSPKKGDEVYTVLTSGLGCVSGNPASSNKITVNVNELLLAGVSVTADKTEICEGEKITFKATPTNGGKNPLYEWFVNGSAIAGETDIIFKYNPKDGDEIYVKLTSGETCIIDPVALSNTIKVTYTDGLLVKVDIAADKTTICIDETVTFTATPENGGDNPVYTWFVNGAKITGQTGMTFAYKPKDGDEVYVQLTSGSTCVIDPVAFSDTITITVTDGLLVKVDIAADKTEMCEGETVTFTATYENSGDNPVYVWFVNGLIRTGETKDMFSYQPKDGDKVYMKLTSSETCVIDPVALSNTIIINVSGELVVSVKLPPQILVCENEPLTVTATTVNGGINPVYTWYLNNVEIKDETSETYTYTPKDKDEIFVTVESDITCTKDNTVTSNVVIISVGDILPPEAICRNITVYLDADGKASITAAQINNGSKDNCKIDTLFQSRYDFDCADVGKNPVTLTAVDAVGLRNTCGATVTVIDNVKPVAKCVAPFSIQLDQNAEYTLTIDQINAGSSDNCGIDTLYLDIYNLTCDHIGLTPITLTAIDVNGNKSYCSTNVTIFGNIAPTIIDDSASTIENVPVVIDVINNDYDEKTSIDISTLSISIKPLHGTVTINPVNGDLTYTPNQNFSGVDVLQYRICDDGIPCEPECGKAFVYITVHAVNEPPVTSDDFFSTGCISISRNVLDNDLDKNTDNLIVNTNPVTPSNHGTVIIDPDGTINYFPNEGFIGIDSFEYVVCNNGIPSLCDTAKVYIKVDCNEVNPNPLECELFIPEGFSPSGDGILDFFRIWCIEHYPDAKLMIFNRNGNLLWQKEHYGNYDYWGDQYNAWWWGTSVLSRYDIGRQMINGEPKLKVGNYIYVLELGNGERKNGTVMISY